MSFDKIKDEPLRALLSLPENKDFFSVESDGRIKCSLNGHSFVARLDVVSAFINGSKYKNMRRKSDQNDFKKWEPFIVPSKNREGMLFCSLTCRLIERNIESLQRHVKGKKFSRARKRFEESGDLMEEPTLMDDSQGAVAGGDDMEDDAEGFFVPVGVLDELEGEEEAAGAAAGGEAMDVDLEGDAEEEEEAEGGSGSDAEEEEEAPAPKKGAKKGKGKAPEPAKAPAAKGEKKAGKGKGGRAEEEEAAVAPAPKPAKAKGGKKGGEKGAVKEAAEKAVPAAAAKGKGKGSKPAVPTPEPAVAAARGGKRPARGAAAEAPAGKKRRS